MFLSAPSASLRAFKGSHSLSLLPPPWSSLLCRLVVSLIPPPLILLTLPPPPNAQPWPIKAPSPLVCLSYAGWLLHRLLLRASASRHFSLHSRRTRLSSTPPLCSRQLVVASHLFVLPLPLDTPPSQNWLCHCRRQCAGVVAVNAQASLS